MTDIIIRPSAKKPWYDRNPVPSHYLYGPINYTGTSADVTMFSHTVSAGRKGIVTGGCIYANPRVSVANAGPKLGYFSTTSTTAGNRYAEAHYYTPATTLDTVIVVPAMYGHVFSEGESVYGLHWVNSSETWMLVATLTIVEFDT